MTALSGGAGGRRKLFERSEFFRRPVKVGSLGVSTEAGRAFFGSFLCTSKERDALPGAPGQTPWAYVASANQRTHMGLPAEKSPCPLWERGEP